jgi:hypothetical protein
MRTNRILGTHLAFLSLIMSGCYTVEYRDPTVCQFPAGDRPAQATVSHPSEFVLERFAADPSATQSALTYQRTVWDHVTIASGAKVGFRQEKNQLIAFAGPTTMPLEQGNYYWVSVGESETQGAFKKPRDQDVIQTVLNVTIIWPTLVAFGAALLYIAAGAPPKHF